MPRQSFSNSFNLHYQMNRDDESASEDSFRSDLLGNVMYALPDEADNCFAPSITNKFNKINQYLEATMKVMLNY